jgi:hypothetical protein
MNFFRPNLRKSCRPHYPGGLVSARKDPRALLKIFRPPRLGFGRYERVASTALPTMGLPEIRLSLAIR